MKVLLWSRRVDLTTGQPPDGEDRDRAPVAYHLSVADKAAFALLAVGLLALGGVLFAAGIAVLIGLAAAGTVIGGVAVLRHKLLGPPREPLGRGEIVADAVVLDTPKHAEGLSAPSTPPPRGD